MQDFWKILYQVTGKIYVPGELMTPSVKILHISDTPYMIYRSIVRLIRKIQPDVLIHTGDVADDVKLEMLPQQIKKYRARAREFLHAAVPCVKGRFIVVPGNHDSVGVLKSVKGVEIFEEGSILQVYGLRIGLAHKPDNLPASCDYYMYGHCRTDINDSRYLNGIDSINVIVSEESRVVKLLYPTGTDDYRLRRSKIGI